MCENEQPQLKHISAYKLQKLLNKEDYVSQYYALMVINTDKLEDWAILSNKIQEVLYQFVNLFKKSTTLPPPRSANHKI